MAQLKVKLMSLCGILFLILGVIFIVLPGPAILCIPLGLALLSLEYPIAKAWLRKYQRYSRVAAQKTDQGILKLKRLKRS